MPPHNLPLRQALIRSVAEECGSARAIPFQPHALAYEAFNMTGVRTVLLDPLQATSISDALAETTSRWAWDRGDRLGVREIGTGRDRLYIYAVRRKATGVLRDFTSVKEHARWLEHICTIDLNVIAGIDLRAVGAERDLHARRQVLRPEGATR